MVETQQTACTSQLEQKSPQNSLGNDKLLCYNSFCNQTPRSGHNKQTRGLEKITCNAEAGGESRHICDVA